MLIYSCSEQLISYVINYISNVQLRNTENHNHYLAICTDLYILLKPQSQLATYGRTNTWVACKPVVLKIEPKTKWQSSI